MVVAIQTTTAIRQTTAAIVREVRSVTRKPAPVMFHPATATSRNNAHATGSVMQPTCALIPTTSAAVTKTVIVTRYPAVKEEFVNATTVPADQLEAVRTTPIVQMVNIVPVVSASQLHRATPSMVTNNARPTTSSAM